MYNEQIEAEFQRWLSQEKLDDNLRKELKELEDEVDLKKDAFYKELSFGTGGLRGLLGVGTNRMNIYTVAKASQGLADYVKKNFVKGHHKIAIGYDSRVKSEVFAKVASDVFAENSIHVYIYPQLMPTPCLSYAVRKLGCSAGVMITASHNPAQYNGYKVYGPDGCQITLKAAKEIEAEISKLDIFEDVRRTTFETRSDNSLIEYIPDNVVDDFIEEVKSQTKINSTTIIDKEISIVYSPLNGTGLKPVLRALKESGYINIGVVEEQEKPDGNFPTCSYPNPEVPEAMELGVEYAKRMDADIMLATDPDCDRIGVAVRKDKGEYELLSGNETGILLLDYICTQLEKAGQMPKNPLLVKTIVTTDMAEQIAANYGVHTINVLTGFKYIGEQIGLLEQKEELDSYVFGFEESCGYLSGPYVRDKDAVGAALLICEMTAYYHGQGSSLYKRLQYLYKKYGYCLNTLHSYEFTGENGDEKMQRIMKKIRNKESLNRIESVEKYIDYAEGINELPKANVLKVILNNSRSIVIRPSGTEPKLKIYISVSAENREEAQKKEREISKAVEYYCK